jgi:hypothetical protein
MQEASAGAVEPALCAVFIQDEYEITSKPGNKVSGFADIERSQRQDKKWCASKVYVIGSFLI